MKFKLMVSLYLVFASLTVGAHNHRDKRIHYTKAQKEKMYSSPHAITGNLGFGAVGGYAAASAGLEYERFVHPSGFLSATVLASGYLGGHLGLGPLKEGDVWSQNYGFFIAPGLRFHPIRHRHLIDLGIGINNAIGYGRRRDDVGYGILHGSAKTVEKSFFGAVLGEFTANFLKGDWHGIQSFFITGGYIYANAKARNYFTPHGSPAHSENDPLYLQFGFRLGGRW